MAVEIAAGYSEDDDPVAAFSEAAGKVGTEIGSAPDLCLVFAAAPHVAHAKAVLAAVHDALEPTVLIGCGAGGVLGPGVESEQGPGAVVWGMRAPGSRISAHHVTGVPGTSPDEIEGLPDPGEPVSGLVVLADPYTFAADALLERLNDDRPGTPVLGGLASAAIGGLSILMLDGEVIHDGAVVCALEGVEMLPCVSQGATPVGPEMTITGARDHVITELASKPAMERLGEVITGLDPGQRALAAGGILLGIVIDENRPEHERGDFLVRPVIGADPDSGAIAVGERVRVGQTVCLHVRDAGTADADLRSALQAQAAAIGSEGAAGALVFSCNGRGSGMFDAPDHDALAIEDALGAPSAGFFAAGEIGPVVGRNFLHGFTATIAVFPAR